MYRLLAVLMLVGTMFIQEAIAAPARKAQVAQRQIRAITHARMRTWHWQRVMHVRLAPTNYGERRTHSMAYRSYLVRHWLSEERRTRLALSHVPHLSAWLCIHRGEGAWNSNTGNGYFGGLQMDESFMATYGGALLRLKGTADRWLPVEQLWTAEYAYESGRGFTPWPNTARACGLL